MIVTPNTDYFLTQHSPSQLPNESTLCLP